jgi:glycyl-tRNA synthetase alpha subunit
VTRYDAGMQHSIAAGFAAWPARYVHPSARARERRLGLHPGRSFTSASSRATVLHRPDAGPLTALRAPWRAPVIEPARAPSDGRPRPSASMCWTRGAGAGLARRASVAPAWRA